ncbi:MAG: hypothetical protein V8S36_08305 [Lachnospiraceae bacterium]
MRSPKNRLRWTACIRSVRAEELTWFADQVNNKVSLFIKAVLTDDIDLNNLEWVPMGGYEKEIQRNF